MVKYFVHGAKNKQEEQEVIEGIKKHIKNKKVVGFEVTDRKIYSIKYKHNGKEYQAEVGKKHEPVGEHVTAIFETSKPNNPFLVCTPNRGVIRGTPILVGKKDVEYVIDFESEDE